MIDNIKAFFEGLFMRICFLGLAVISGRIGWFFLDILFGIIDKYDVSTSDGQHIDFFKAGVHLFPMMGSCIMAMAFIILAILLIVVAFSRDEHKDKELGDNEEKEDIDSTRV